MKSWGEAGRRSVADFVVAMFDRTWIVTALDAGFATAMPVKPKWLRDILSVAFSGYYLIFAHEADEKVRSFDYSLFATTADSVR